MGFTRRSIPAISAHIVAPFTSSLQLHWLLRKDVAISKKATKLEAFVSQLQSGSPFEKANAIYIVDMNKSEFVTMECCVSNNHLTSIDLAGWEAGLEEMMLVPNYTIIFFNC